MLIFSYTRAQAIEDGVLIDVTETAKEVGIRYPTALTSTVWERYVRVPDGVTCQDQVGRLWDILFLFALSSIGKKDCSQFVYSLSVRNQNGPEMVRLKAVCGPGDNLEPVITIMLPEED
jgi:hypothetical protein